MGSGEAGHLATLIRSRSQVRILPPLLQGQYSTRGSQVGVACSSVGSRESERRKFSPGNTRNAARVNTKAECRGARNNRGGNTTGMPNGFGSVTAGETANGQGEVRLPHPSRSSGWRCAGSIPAWPTCGRGRQEMHPAAAGHCGFKSRRSLGLILESSVHGIHGGQECSFYRAIVTSRSWSAAT